LNRLQGIGDEHAMTGPQAELGAIPVRDVRDGGPLRHAVEARVAARALRDECVSWFPRAAQHAIPMLDRITRRWLTRSRSPYVAEIAAIATALDFPGIWFLNGAYEWGCTALACEAGAPWLARTLDWPFPGLGRHVEVARMAGSAGEFYSVTWPGFVGALTAMAPGRFAASVNQAPLWRRTRRPALRLYDIAANAMATWRLPHIPPDQLLRHVCETSATFDDARRALEGTPIARPVIYTLVGCAAGERCVIERTEEGFATRFENTCAANDWLAPKEPWEARVGGDLLFSCSFDEAGGNSRVRREALAAWTGGFGESFAWVKPPVLNRFTRLATEMCPAHGTLRVIGYEVPPDADLPAPATRAREIITRDDAPTRALAPA
jgi:hypothetical protein